MPLYEDLLFAQGVCKQWQYSIQRSIKCQQALFLVPCNAEDMRRGHEVVQIAAHTHAIQNPRSLYDGIIFNPLLVQTITNDELLGSRPNQETASQLLIDVLRNPPPAPASFHRMYISQPPLYVQSVKLEYTRETKLYRHMTYAMGTGLTTLNVGALGQDILSRMVVSGLG